MGGTSTPVLSRSNSFGVIGTGAVTTAAPQSSSYDQPITTAVQRPVTNTVMEQVPRQVTTTVTEPGPRTVTSTVTEQYQVPVTTMESSTEQVPRTETHMVT